MFGGGLSQPNRPAPFSLGQPPTTTSAGLGSASLFSKPLTAPASIVPPTSSAAGNLFGSTNNTSKPAFQLPTINTSSTTAFGPTINSAASGTLFGGSALFGAK